MSAFGTVKAVGRQLLVELGLLGKDSFNLLRAGFRSLA